MGIRGLSTFFNNNPDLSKSFKLHDTPVVIDGNNLIHLLYFSSKIDCMYGGDYYKYSTAIKKYFSSYLDCNIKPIVIFDGGYDKSDRKFHTSLLRSKTRLSITEHIAKYGECSGNILPVCAKEVFRNVLSEIGIPFAQCDFEADDQVTALANHYNCPVLSDDSDFYIFDIHNGFIRLSSVDTTVLEADIDGAKCKFLKCDIYYIDKFLSYFPGIDRNVLPLFGTLVGNDYVNTKEFETFFASIQLSKRSCRGLRVNPRQKKIVRLLTWLEHCNLNEAIKQILCHLKKKNRDRIESVINQSIDGYKTQNCNLTLVIDDKLEDLEKTLKMDSKLMTPCGRPLPIPFAIAFHLGNLPSYFLNIVNLHRTFLSAQVENTFVESSYVCSRYIRQVIYGILLQHTAIDEKAHEDYCLQNIAEYDRRSGRVSRQTISPVFHLKDGRSLPSLDGLFGWEKSFLQQLLLDVLGTESAFISSIPDSLQLLFSCIIYWLKNSSPATKEDFVYALVLNIIYFHVILKKTPLTKKPDSYSKIENSEQLSVSSLINNVSTEDAELAARNLKKYLQKPTLNRGNPLILHIVHSFSQLQTCMLHTLYLNSLFSFPFKNPKLHEAFAGTMLYNLTKDLSSRPFPDLFVSELMGRQSSLSVLFKVLKSKIYENVTVDCIERVDRSYIQKNKKESKKSYLKESFDSRKPDIESVSNQFERMRCIEEVPAIDSLGEIFI